MIWPPDDELRSCAWWNTPAWSGGPTFGQLVGALRPALRAVWLLGWQVESIDVGASVIPAGQSGPWQSVDRATLVLDPAAVLPGPRATAQPTVRLGVMEVASLTGGLGGSFAIPVVFPDFVTTAGPDTGGAVPADLVTRIDEFVDDAVALLTVDPAYLDGPVARQGLLWTLSPGEQWRGLSPLAELQLGAATSDRRSNTADFLYGQLYGDQNLETLLGLAQDRARDDEPETEGFSVREISEPLIWQEILTSLRARGEAHRLREQPRRQLVGPDAPCWLDVFTELLTAGVIVVDQILEPGEPVDPVVARELAGAVPTVELTIWGGDGSATLTRVTTFDSEGNSGLAGSFAWDYLPGDAQQPPEVLIVAGRGVAVGHDHAEVDDRPWRIQIVRVQDDTLVPVPGEQINLMKLMAPYPIAPEPEEHDAFVSGAYPVVMVRPKPDGVYLMYPSSGAVKDGPNGPILGPDPPCVIELTLSPLSGTAAYTVDVHYYDWPWGGAGYYRGGAHLCVWASPDVTIHTTDSEGNGAPVTGNPSAVDHQPYPIPSNWLYTAELWTAEPARLLPRPFRTYLAPTAGVPSHPDLLHTPSQPALPPAGLSRTPATHSFKEYQREEDLMLTLVLALFDILWSFIPLVGDATDVGEATLVWHTGHDRWGRPMSDFERAMTYVTAGIPILSSGFLRGATDILKTLGNVTDEGAAALARLFTRAGPQDVAPAEQISGALAAAGTTRKMTRFRSPTDSQQAEALIRSLAPDSAAVIALAQRLVGTSRAGWLTVADLLNDAGNGFVVPVLQTAYARYQRLHGNVPVATFLAVAGG